MVTSFAEIFSILLLPLFGPGQPATDLLSLVDPAMALETLGVKAEDDALAELIRTGGPAEGDGGAKGYNEKEVETAIQNLASKSEGIREKARATLTAAGPAVRARLEKVVSGDERRAAEAKKVLEGLASVKASSSHRQDVVRILALRLAAERKLASTLPAAVEAAKSEAFFLRRAAQEAQVALGEAAKAESAAKTEPASAALPAAVEALPGKETRFLLALTLNTATATAGSGLRLDRMIRQVAASVPGALPPEQLEGELRKATSKVVDFVIAYGNVFPERAYVVNVGGVGPRSQGLAVVASGHYEREVLEKGLGANGSGWTRSEVAGVGVYTSTGMKIALLDGQTVMVLPARESHFPLEDVLKNLKEKTSSLRSEPRWARFLDALKPDPGVRALAITDETLMAEMREEVRREGSAPQEVRDGVLGMQELELTSGLLDDGKARVRVEASFQEEKEARGLVEFLKAQVATGITMLEQFSGSPEAPPVMKKGIEVLKAVHLAAEGKKGIARLEMDPLKFEELPALMGGVMLRTVPLER